MGSVSRVYECYGEMEERTRVKVNEIVSVLLERNKEVVNRHSNEAWISSLVEAYKQPSTNQETIFLLRILQF